MQALFHFGMFASPSCTRVHHILSVRLQHTLWPGPCGNNLEQLTCSAVWLIQAVQACILKCMHLCNIRRHKDAFKQSFMYTYSIHMMFVWQGLHDWSSYISVPSLSCIVSLRNLILEEKKKVQWLYLDHLFCLGMGKVQMLHSVDFVYIRHVLFGATVVYGGM